MRSLVRLLQSPAIMASAISTIFSSCDPDELCDRSKLLSQEKQTGKNSNIIKKELLL